jgi:predicted AAA+ superfamily ATPase
MTITPVQLAGNEIYEILKKRLIDELPDERVISDVAEEYAQQIKKAEDGGYIVASSIEQIAEQVRETYPFHPSFKHLVALFKENEGFRQTRGLMQFTARLLKSVDEREADDVFLIGTQHLNLNDEQVKDEIERIAPKLMPAVTRDIADAGNAIAEHIDGELAGDAAQQLMTLLLSSSLSRAVGGRIGLSESELIEFLARRSASPTSSFRHCSACANLRGTSTARSNASSSRKPRTSRARSSATPKKFRNPRSIRRSSIASRASSRRLTKSHIRTCRCCPAG